MGLFRGGSGGTPASSGQISRLEGTRTASWFATGLCLLSMLVFVSGARAGWLPPRDISEAGEQTGAPEVVLDAAGNATAVWERWDGEDMVVESAYRPAGGAWQAPMDISENGEEVIQSGEHDAYSPRLAVDAAGDTTVVWSRSSGTNLILIQAVYRPAGGTWQAPVDLGAMHSAVDPEPWVASDEAGDVTAVWTSDEVIESSQRPAGGSWEPSVALSASASSTPQAAVDAQGDATAVWSHYNGTRSVVEGDYRPAGKAWESATLISRIGEGSGNPQIALNARGDALVAWDGEATSAAYRPFGGSWESPVDVPATGGPQALNVALNAQGEGLLVWSSGGGSGYQRVQAATRTLSGEWQEPISLSEDGENAFPSDVVFDSQGNAAVVWERSIEGDDIVQADYRPAGGSWQTPVNLSEEDRDSTDAVVVLDAPGISTLADGDATAVWSSSEGGCWKIECGPPPPHQVQAAGYDPIEPAGALEVPAVGKVGTPVTFSVPSLDVWSPLLSFGDGSEAAATEVAHTYEAAGEYTVKFSSTDVLGYSSSTQRRIVIEPAAPTKPPTNTGGQNTGLQNEGPAAPAQPGVSVIQPGAPPSPAPMRFGIKAARQTMRMVRRTRELRFACHMSAPGTCVVRTSLGSGRVALGQAGTATVTIRLTPATLLAIRRLHILRLTFVGTAISDGHPPVKSAGKLVAR